MFTYYAHARVSKAKQSKRLAYRDFENFETLMSLLTSLIEELN